MELKPVAHTQKPKYPHKYEIDVNKVLLENRPKAWFAKPIVGLALSAVMAAGLAGWDCSGDSGITGGIDEWVPVYVSDADALTIIADELSKSGFGFVSGAGESDAEDNDFDFDGYFLNGENKIDVEYVSQEDCEAQKYPVLTYQNYCYPQNTATQLKELYPDAAVFYDPVTEWQEGSEEHIRNQVLDFIEWLLGME
ncbi:MAG: hypothetical protein FWD58_00870 [Firmicutes bacterium]|nr:hypothetical protein [Bacillota bacterium]